MPIISLCDISKGWFLKGVCFQPIFYTQRCLISFQEALKIIFFDSVDR